ncbi:MAG: CPBP family intramembrane metalloprotease [Anaerolineae bacterium]|nr:CPBP family intramembrane metalloprotease [Anaerolineae bacterium]
MYTISLPIKRRFRWRALWILIVLWFLANLAAIPLLQATNAPVEPVWLWGTYTAIMTILIAIGLYLAGRTGLGAPLIEGLLDKSEIGNWARSVLAWALLAAIVGSLIVLSMSLDADPERYPAIWQLILASIKAGVTEEIWMRLLLMSVFVWLGSLISKDSDGRPTQGVFGVAIVLCALLFGGSHVESQLAVPGVTGRCRWNRLGMKRGVR